MRARSWLKPFSMVRDGVRVHSHIAYADAGKRNLLDIYHPQEQRDGGFPVLLQVHGGGWRGGNRRQQARPLMDYLASHGWLSAAISYPLSPDATFPDHLVAVKQAIGDSLVVIVVALAVAFLSRGTGEAEG